MPGGRNRGRGRSRSKPKVVLVFGENENDTRTIKELLQSLWHDSPWKIEARKRPPVLIKDAKASDLPSRVQRIAAIIEAEKATSEVIAVFAHEDCDSVEPAHVGLEAKIGQAFADAGYDVEAAVPAWEIEAWLMQWPDAFARHVPSWRSVSSYQGRNVGLISHAKEDLTRALRPHSGGRDYRESDAPIIAGIVAKEGWVRTPQATSNSYLAFLTAADRVAAAQPA